jgi:hypothetical protein
MENAYTDCIDFYQANKLGELIPDGQVEGFLTAKCPYCGDEISINPDTGEASCLECGKGGNPVDFMKDYYPNMKWNEIVDVVKEYFPNAELKKTDSNVPVITEVVEQVKECTDKEEFIRNQFLLNQIAYVKKNSQADWITIQDEIKSKFGLGKRELDNLIKEAERTTEPENTRPLYEKEGCYYRTKKVDGGVVAEKISNFILVINEIMTMPNGENVVSADLKLDGSYVSKNINISNRDLLSKNSLQSALQKTGTKWLGNETDYGSANYRTSYLSGSGNQDLANHNQQSICL